MGKVGHCSPTSVYGWLVQLCIGILGISSIGVKWSCESPRRSLTTLLLDVSKQIVGGFITHFTKVAFSVIIKKMSDDGDCDSETTCCDTECVAYVVQSAFQALLVIPPAAFVLHLSTKYAERRGYETLYPFGDYGLPLQRKRLFHQLAMWALIMALCNAVIEAVFFIPLHEYLNDLGRAMLSWVRCAGGDAELWVVILAIPLFIDTLQYLVYDQIIKNKYLVIDEADAVASVPVLGTTNDGGSSDDDKVLRIFP
ncbi:hypothetical protein DIPPA_30317 [Diplonema papillatum]|nr:hypothetical protein DIPPA_30317 [Diplonema papillatum]